MGQWVSQAEMLEMSQMIDSLKKDSLLLNEQIVELDKYVQCIDTVFSYTVHAFALYYFCKITYRLIKWSQDDDEYTTVRIKKLKK